jgi:hypothetical protein
MFAVDKQAHSSCYEGGTPFQSILFRCDDMSHCPTQVDQTPRVHLAKIVRHRARMKSVRRNFMLISVESLGPSRSFSGFLSNCQVKIRTKILDDRARGCNE